MYSIAYFSPTGNTRYLAERLIYNLYHGDAKFIDIVHSDGKEVAKNNHLIIMFSIHAFNAPPEVVKFVQALPESKFNQVSIIAVGCNNIWINEGASFTLRKILNDKGYKLALDRIIAMPLSFVIKFQEEMGKRLVLEAEAEINKIVEDLNNKVTDAKVIKNKAKVVTVLGKGEKFAARLFGLELYANNKCTSCGLCWAECPSKNIREKNMKPKFGFKCSMCMRCIYSCPMKAINPRISKFIPIKGGYNVKDYISKKEV